jgi:hypothetical protein
VRVEARERGVERRLGERERNGQARRVRCLHPRSRPRGWTCGGQLVGGGGAPRPAEPWRGRRRQGAASGGAMVRSWAAERHIRQSYGVVVGGDEAPRPLGGAGRVPGMEPCRCGEPPAQFLFQVELSHGAIQVRRRHPGSWPPSRSHDVVVVVAVLLGRPGPMMPPGSSQVPRAPADSGDDDFLWPTGPLVSGRHGCRWRSTLNRYTHGSRAPWPRPRSSTAHGSAQDLAGRGPNSRHRGDLPTITAASLEAATSCADQVVDQRLCGAKLGWRRRCGQSQPLFFLLHTPPRSHGSRRLA